MSLFHCLPSSSSSRLPSPSLSLRSPRCFLCIAHRFPCRWVLFWTWSCAAHIAKKKIILLLTSKPSLRRDTLGLGTPGTLWGWALQPQGDSGVGRTRQTLGLGAPNTVGLGTPGRLSRDTGVGRSRSGLGTPETLCGWALPGEEKSSGRGEELRLRSNNPTSRVGNKRKEHKDKGS